MSAKIRKLTLSYPFVVDNRQQRTVYTVDDGENTGGKKVHTIQETYDQYHKAMKYSICVRDGEHVKLWKDEVPFGCTIQIEYFLS